jgi:hypothetical protein
MNKRSYFEFVDMRVRFTTFFFVHLLKEVGALVVLDWVFAEFVVHCFLLHSFCLKFGHASILNLLV